MHWFMQCHNLCYPVPPFFSLSACFSCGQTFRFHQVGEKWHGIVNNSSVCLFVQNNTLFIQNQNMNDAPFWTNFFSFNLNYQHIHSLLSSNSILAEAVAFAPGIRVLTQPFFETLITFIISQNNNIPRITGIVHRLCHLLGTPLEYGTYSFPPAERLAQCSLANLEPLRAGFRGKYLLDAAKKVADGTVTFQTLSTLPTTEARTQLLTIKGVGPKVADCVLLFSCARFEVCPMDVWMLRVMKQHYPQGFPASIQPYAGIAQQYLFHYARQNPSFTVDGPPLK